MKGALAGVLNTCQSIPSLIHLPIRLTNISHFFVWIEVHVEGSVIISFDTTPEPDFFNLYLIDGRLYP